MGEPLDRGLVGVIDAYLSFPYILIAIVWAALIRMTTLTLVLIIALRGWVEFARVVRAQVVAIREREFVVAARALGATRGRRLAPPVQVPKTVSEPRPCAF